jgi:hypothetical protein
MCELVAERCRYRKVRATFIEVSKQVAAASNIKVRRLVRLII